ncbi:MAG: hypothetical protein K0S18_1993, partial [Anaerocolumna sp.]|nr:hypothetical protein [Anaerocolumna sp.]
MGTDSWFVLLGSNVSNYLLYKRKRKKLTQIVERNVFFIDQLLHSICLTGIAYWFVRNNIQPKETPIFMDFFNMIEISEVQVLSWLLALLIIHKPANIAISKLLMIYKPENKN